MSKIIYSVATSFFLVLGVSAPSVNAQSSFSSPGAKPASGIERARSDVRSFGTKHTRTYKKAKTKVPSSMDLFVGRCKDAGGGLISIDGHYDCVKPSGEPIPDW